MNQPCHGVKTGDIKRAFRDLFTRKALTALKVSSVIDYFIPTGGNSIADGGPFQLGRHLRMHVMPFIIAVAGVEFGICRKYAVGISVRQIAAPAALILIFFSLLVPPGCAMLFHDFRQVL